MFTRTTAIAAAFSTVFAAASLTAPAPASADPKHCPPGHAMKGWCGNRGGGHKQRNRHRHHVGDHIGHDTYIVIRDYRRYGYPEPRPGYGYVRVNEDIYLIALGTGLIIQALTN